MFGSTLIRMVTRAIELPIALLLHPLGIMVADVARVACETLGGVG